MKDVVVIRGAGDLATGIGHRLHRSGFKIVMLDIEKPLVIRRTVSFAQAIFEGEIEIDGVTGIRVETIEEVKKAWEDGNIPVMVDPECKIIESIKADILVDAIMAKRNIGTKKDMAPITIAIGPGFEANKDVDVVIETNRGHYLGSLIFEGKAQENTGIPGLIMGYGKERVIKSPESGVIKNIKKIGDVVKKGEDIAYVENVPVKATLDGTLRGIIKNGSKVLKDLKIADIDPRCSRDHCFTISDKARSIGGGVLEAILYMKNKKGM
ncbi:selenium-dependent molybdenum hydroxylase system protein, YqeB family [Gottschalkia purinilytica]|uniref:Selenium-dependent molybdenum hydroxylase system protein, YqeB family n=1 Tax=Gottschalkia purinilytica TaxID=1503 RepID=A0A0L0W6E2_GOTPU|nr:selenium-dependent molybdenum cofactor biosynthesis protein YqeB [Gottschalkia purinilytica]KNF07098.1 selenium-dependent molybdenum hydroxylase system protein, YqeB family [Gottschalkia purinilytica]